MGILCGHNRTYNSGDNRYMGKAAVGSRTLTGTTAASLNLWKLFGSTLFVQLYLTWAWHTCFLILQALVSQWQTTAIDASLVNRAKLLQRTRHVVGAWGPATFAACDLA